MMPESIFGHDHDLATDHSKVMGGLSRRPLLRRRKAFLCKQHVLFVCSMLLLTLGCGSKDFGTVTGTVTYEGGTIPVGTKIFFQLPGAGYVAAAKIDETGAFQLSFQASPKIQVGEYTVFFGPPESNLSQDEFFKLKKQVDAEYRKRGKRPPPSPDWTLPEEYYQPHTTPLKESVVAGRNTIDIQLED